MLSAHFATRTCLTTIVYAVATERLASWGWSIKRRRLCTLGSPCLTKSELSTFPVGNRFLMLNFNLNISHRQQKALTIYTSIGLVNTAPNSDTFPQNFFAVIDCQVGVISQLHRHCICIPEHNINDRGQGHGRTTVALFLE